MELTGDYAQNIIALSLWTDAVEETGWRREWTMFYWGWWIAWSPFVGMFIARISRGRTIREFIVGVLLVPTGFTFVWLTVLGGTGLNFEAAGVTQIAGVIEEDESTAIFIMLEELPLATITAIVTVIVVTTFFVTSSDSGSLVIDMLASGGSENSPKIQRVFWAILEGVVAAILLVAGGLAALRTASIASGLPFAMIMVVICFSLAKGLRTEPIFQPPEETEPEAPEDLYGTRDLEETEGAPEEQEVER